MSNINREVNHSLGLDKAKETIAKIVADVQADYPSLVKTVKWNGDKTSADVKGTGFNGSFKTTESKTTISIKLGLIGRPFKGKIETQMDDKIKKYFG